MNDLKRREITAILDEMVQLTKALRERGLDAKDPADREAGEIIRRIMIAAHGGRE